MGIPQRREQCSYNEILLCFVAWEKKNKKKKCGSRVVLHCDVEVKETPERGADNWNDERGEGGPKKMENDFLSVSEADLNRFRGAAVETF